MCAFLILIWNENLGGPIGETALHIASRIEDSRGLKCTQMLIKSGADINLAMADGKTPLHISADTGTIAVFRYLLSNGAEPTKQDNVIFTILQTYKNMLKDASFIIFEDFKIK